VTLSKDNKENMSRAKIALFVLTVPIGYAVVIGIGYIALAAFSNNASAVAKADLPNYQLSLVVAILIAFIATTIFWITNFRQIKKAYRIVHEREDRGESPFR
jgi:uncharacterized membrane protein